MFRCFSPSSQQSIEQWKLPCYAPDGFSIFALCILFHCGSQRPLSSDLPSSPCEGLTVTATDSGVLRLTLDRPSRLNSLNEAMFAGVPVVLSRAAGSDGVRAVVITGREEYYSSGFDLGEVRPLLRRIIP